MQLKTPTAVYFFRDSLSVFKCRNFEAIIRNSQRSFLLNILTLTGPGGFYLAVALLVVICQKLRSVRWRRSDPVYRNFAREIGK
jgi:hypothetical protein